MDREQAEDTIFNIIVDIAYGKKADIAQVVEDIFDIITASNWISVEDRLPEQDGYYLVNVLCELANGVYLAKFENGATFMWYPFSKADVTHWMPLPEPPESEE